MFEERFDMDPTWNGYNEAGDSEPIKEKLEELRRNEKLQIENAQLKSHNRKLVEAAKESLALHQDWRSTADPEELAYYSEHKLVINGLIEALQTPEAKLALAEEEVLQATSKYFCGEPCEDLRIFFENQERMYKAVKEMKDAKQ